MCKTVKLINNEHVSLSEPLMTKTEMVDFNDEIESEHRTPIDKLSQNVPIAITFTGVAFISRSLWNQNVLAMFIFQVSGRDSRTIGYVTSLMGLLQLFSSFPGGYFADKYRRDIVIRYSAVIGILSTALVVSAVALKNLWLIGGAFATVGTYWGLTTTSISALFADSLTDEERPKYITWRYTVQKLGNLTAPILATVMFARAKNHWSEEDCANIIYCSQALGIISVLIPCFMSDDKISMRNTLSIESDVEEIGDHISMGSSGETAYTTLPESDESVTSAEYGNDTYDKMIPICICSADILQGFANGMSVQFFPLFFANNLDMRPIYVQIVYMCSQGGQACGSLVGFKIGKVFGRCFATILLRFLGCIALGLMLLFGKIRLGPSIVCTFYVLRMIFTNSTVPLTGSILMDYVPKHHRGKWGSLDSLVKASWSGSAFIGGFLIHRYGIYSVFYVTIILQLIATIPLFFILPKVYN